MLTTFLMLTLEMQPVFSCLSMFDIDASSC